MQPITIEVDGKYISGIHAAMSNKQIKLLFKRTIGYVPSNWRELVGRKKVLLCYDSREI